MIPHTANRLVGLIFDDAVCEFIRPPVKEIPRIRDYLWMPKPTPSQKARRYAQEAAERHGITSEQVLGRNTSKKPVAARHEVIRRLSSEGHSANQIGFLLGLHHTSVLSVLGRLGRQRNPQPVDGGVLRP